MKFATIRKYAMSMEAVTEEPHHDYSSFRVRGKIFVTIPPGNEFIHVFVGEDVREIALAMHPDSTKKLMWGSKALGLRINLASSQPAMVKSLVAKAYETRVQKDAGSQPIKPKREAAKS